MKYRVIHKTEYDYAEQVPLCYNMMRLRPRDTQVQRCLEHEVVIRPAPADRRDRTDFFGNHVTWIALQEPHMGLEIIATSEVENTAISLPEDVRSPAWESLPVWIDNRSDPLALEVRQYTYDSPMVPRDSELADFARKDFTPGRPLIEAINALTHRIYDEFTFDTDATTIGTPVLEVLEHRHGVCQDFAHLQIGCLRSLGLPARYVSGYLLTLPPPGKKRLIGADASHAWISAYVPEIGWVDFDPTNGCLPADKHITIGWARDFEDISPVRGIITGARSHHLTYAVDVEPIGQNGETAAPSESASPPAAGDARSSQ